MRERRSFAVSERVILALVVLGMTALFIGMFLPRLGEWVATHIVTRI